MREEWAKIRSIKQMQSIFVVYTIVIAGLAIMLPLAAPKVSAQVTHLLSTFEEDSMGMPYDVTPMGDMVVMWDYAETHIMSQNYVVLGGYELIIPALNNMASPPTGIEVQMPINITVEAGGKLTFLSDGPLTKTVFQYTGGGVWDGIYFAPGSEGLIQDVEINGAKTSVTFSPGSIISSPGIQLSRFQDFIDYGLYIDGAVGDTDIQNSVSISDTNNLGTGIFVSNGMLNLTDVYYLGHGSGKPSLQIKNATVTATNNVFNGLDQPGNAIMVENSPSPGSTVASNCIFDNGVASNYYVMCNGASPLIDNCTFNEANNALAVLANESSTGVASHPLLRNPNPSSSFDNTTIDAVGNSTVSLQWWVDVYVKDFDNNPIPNAPVWIMDAHSNPAEPYSKVTGTSGWARWFLATELVQHDGWKVNYNPFNISAENNSVVGYADIENSSVTQSRTSIVVIGPFPLVNNTLPIVSWISTPVGIQSGPVTIEYILYDLDPGDNGDLSVEVYFWDPFSMAWLPATPHPASDPTTGLSSGITYTFVWDSNDPKDFHNKYSTDVYIKIIPYDNAGVGIPNQTGNFTVDNTFPSINTPPVVSWLTTPVGIQSGLVTVEYILMDPDPGDDGNLYIEVYFSIDNTTWYPATQGPGGDTTTGLFNNTLYQFVWDSQDPSDLPGIYCTTVYLRVVPYDLTGGGTPAQTGNFTLDNKAPSFPSPPININIQLSPGTLDDIKLLWSASEDDGAGYNDVVGYTVYKSSNGVNGTYGFAAWIPATGSPYYMWADIGAGDGDWNDYYYIVRANDTSGNEEQNAYKVGKCVNYLVDDWNLISVPLVQLNTTMQYVFQTILDNVIAVKGYHAGKSTPWKNWHNGKPNYMNNLIEIDHESGYYVKMLVPDHLVVCGRVPSGTSIPLKAGWNLVGYPSVIPRTVTDALVSIAGMYNKVEFYNTTTDREEPLAPYDYIHPGLGYWIHCTADCVWEVVY